MKGKEKTKQVSRNILFILIKTGLVSYFSFNKNT